MSAIFRIEKIPPCFFSQGWGESRKNLSIIDNPLTVGGVKYAHGYGTHSPGEVCIQLDGKATEISGAVGIDDETENKGTAYFKIIDADTKKILFRTDELKGGAKAVPFNVNIRSVKKLWLEWEPGVSGQHLSHVDLLDVKVAYSGKTPEPGQLGNFFTVESDNLCWSIRQDAHTGKLCSVAFDIKTVNSLNAKQSELLRTFPPTQERMDALLPRDIYIIQADGSHNCVLVFDSYKAKKSGNMTEHVFTMKDPEYPVTVEQHISVMEKADIFKVHSVIRNTGKKPITLVNRNAAAVALRVSGKAYLSTFHGNWGTEMTVFDEQRIPVGTVSEFNSLISHSSQTVYPGCYISFDGKAKEEKGCVFGAALGWDGNWQYQVSRSNENQISFCAGALPEPRVLEAGDECVTPFVLMTLSEHGKGQVSRNFQRYMMNGGIGKADEVRPVILNSWEGLVFDFDEKKIDKLIADTADLGAEMFVLDDGWFANGEFARDDDTRGLGDWQTNTKKLPNGLGHLADEANKKGLKFGLWFEPEMVNTTSELYRKHPDWVITQPKRDIVKGRGGTQLMLDLSRPEVEKFVYKTIADILKKYPQIVYVKWDHNMRGPNQGAAHLGSRQGGFSDLHNQACMRVAAKLDRDFPNVMFQLCASGGGRADVGMMENFDEFWASDMSQAIPRISIQWGFSHFFPAKAIASHISRHGEDVGYKFRVDVAMTARLGVELNPPDISKENRDIIRKGIKAYKTLRPVVHAGELYRGRSPHDSAQTELTFVLEDKSDAVFFVFDRSGKGGKSFVKPSGLDPKAEYSVTEENPDTKRRFKNCVRTGAELMKNGIEVTFPKEISSAVARLKKA